MRDIDELIKDYCAEILPPEPLWVAALNRWFPRIAARIDMLRSAQLEIEDHLRSSFGDHISKGHNAEAAWDLAREKFGDPVLISGEISRVRLQSRRCLLVRLLALAAFCALPLGKLDPIHPGWFISVNALSSLGVCVAVGTLVTRKRDADSVRKYAFCGAWIGLILGMLKAATVERLELAGDAVAWILLSVFYGLVVAAPAARGLAAAAMVVLGHAGVLIPLIRFGILAPNFNPLEPALLHVAAIASLVSLLFSLVVFDFRKLHRRLTGMAVFGMFLCYVWIFRNFKPCLGMELVFPVSLPLLTAAFMALPIRVLQKLMLRDAA
jgi:hypothetical protein